MQQHEKAGHIHVRTHASHVSAPAPTHQHVITQRQPVGLQRIKGIGGFMQPDDMRQEAQGTTHHTHTCVARPACPPSTCKGVLHAVASERVSLVWGCSTATNGYHRRRGVLCARCWCWGSSGWVPICIYLLAGYIFRARIACGVAALAAASAGGFPAFPVSLAYLVSLCPPAPPPGSLPFPASSRSLPPPFPPHGSTQPLGLTHRGTHTRRGPTRAPGP